MSDTQTQFRDGDIFSWRWRDESRHMPYHCKSRIAVARKGELFDTFWQIGDSASGCSFLDLDEVALTYLGNPSEMTQIREWDLPYYRREDVVSMRHSNNSGAPIYLKAGAERDVETMREHAAYEKQRAEGEIRMAQERIERFDRCLRMIERGEIYDVVF